MPMVRVLRDALVVCLWSVCNVVLNRFEDTRICIQGGVIHFSNFTRVRGY